MDANDWPRLIIGLLWLAFMVSGLVWYFRGRFGQAVQQAMIWVLIFLGFTLAYGLREPLAVALNLTSEVQTDAGDIVLRRDRSGHFVTLLRINGVDIPMVIDTGASQIVLSRNAASQAGIAPETLRFSGRARTANGVVETAPVWLEEVRLGPQTDRNVPATVNAAPMDISLLGMSYLDRFSRITVEGDIMVLKP